MVNELLKSYGSGKLKLQLQPKFSPRHKIKHKLNSKPPLEPSIKSQKINFHNSINSSSLKKNPHKVNKRTDESFPTDENNKVENASIFLTHSSIFSLSLFLNKKESSMIV